VPELLTGEPRQQYRGHVVGPRQQHRGAGVDDHDGAWIGRGDGADEVVLPAGQHQARAIEALAFHFFGGTDDDDGDVRLAGKLHWAVELGLLIVLRRHVELDGEHRDLGAAEGGAAGGAVGQQHLDVLVGVEVLRHMPLGGLHEAFDHIGARWQCDRVVEHGPVVDG
jgi:hypothetical protein